MKIKKKKKDETSQDLSFLVANIETDKTSQDLSFLLAEKKKVKD